MTIATMTDLSSERERYGSEVVGILLMVILVCKQRSLLSYFATG